MLNKLKKKWGITSFFQVVIIFIVFGITGSVSSLFSGPALDFFHIDKNDFNSILYWPLRLLILFPIYQVLLIFFGFVFSIIVSIVSLKRDEFIFNFFYNISIKMSKSMIRVISFGYLFKK